MHNLAYQSSIHHCGLPVQNIGLDKDLATHVSNFGGRLLSSSCKYIHTNSVLGVKPNVKVRPGLKIMCAPCSAHICDSFSNNYCIWANVTGFKHCWHRTLVKSIVPHIDMLQMHMHIYVYACIFCIQISHQDWCKKTYLNSACEVASCCKHLVLGLQISGSSFHHTFP